MKNLAVGITVCLISLTGCSKIPTECQESWNKVEKFGKQIGLSDSDLKIKKKEFEDSILQMDPKQAAQICESQNSFLQLAK
jgi:hypothetical protein